MFILKNTNGEVDKRIAVKDLVVLSANLKAIVWIKDEIIHLLKITDLRLA